MAFRSLKYTYEGKKRVKPESEKLFFLFANFRICDLRIKQYNLRTCGYGLAHLRRNCGSCKKKKMLFYDLLWRVRIYAILYLYLSKTLFGSEKR
jgi:hypothetical protein